MLNRYEREKLSQKKKIINLIIFNENGTQFLKESH